MHDLDTLSSEQSLLRNTQPPCSETSELTIRVFM